MAGQMKPIDIPGTFQSIEQAKGEGSGDIHVTLPSDACPGTSGVYTGSLNFTDDAHGLQISFKIVASGGGACTLKS